MKKAQEIVYKVNSKYVSDDCVQIMTAYNGYLITFNRGNIIYSHINSAIPTVNQYLEDERRKQFPYSNIPIHYSRIPGKGKVMKVNQLLNFDEPYINFADGLIFESFAVKDDDCAFIIDKILTENKKTISVTRSELENLFTDYNNGKETKHVIYLDGTIDSKDTHSIPDENSIANYIKNNIADWVQDFREYASAYPGDVIGRSLLSNPMWLDYVEQSLGLMDFGSLRLAIGIENSQAFIVKTNGNDVSVQHVVANYVSPDNYTVIISDMPVNKYTLEQLKFAIKINPTKDPKIPLRLNPGVSRQDLKAAKQMVKILKQK